MSIMQDPQDTFGRPAPSLSRWRLWTVIVTALTVLALGLGLAVYEWRRHTLDEVARAKSSLQQHAQRLGSQLEADMRERQLLLRGIQIGVFQARKASSEDFDDVVKQVRHELSALQIEGVIHLAAGGAGIQAAWFGVGPRPSAHDLDSALAGMRRRMEEAGSAPTDFRLAPVLLGDAPIFLALPVVAANRDVSVAVVDVNGWLRGRLVNPETSDLALRVVSADGARELFRNEAWGLAPRRSWSETSEISLPEWHIEVGPRSGESFGESGRTVALAYVLVGSLLAALVLFLDGQRIWLQFRVAAMTRELEASRERLQRALIVTREGAVEYVPATRKLYCSDRLRVMLDLESETPSVSDLLYLVGRSHRAALSRALRGLQQGGHAMDETLQMRVGEGPDRWLRVRALAQLDADGKVERVTASVSDISGEVAQRLQQESYRDFLHELMNVLPVPLSVKDADLRWIIVNKAYCAIERRAASDFLGRRSAEVAGPHIGHRLEEMDRATLENGTLQVACLWLERPDGVRNYVRISKIRCNGPDGRHLVLSSIEDLTQVQQKQEDETALHTFYQNVFDALPHPVYIKDAQHRYVMTNRAHAESRNCSKEQIIGSTSFEHAQIEVARQIEVDENRLFLGTAPPVLEHEYPLLQPDGRLHRTIVRKVALRGMDGSPMLVGINTDITALRDMEDSLRAALYRFSILFEKAPLGIALIEYGGRMLDANPSFLQMTGYSRQEIQALSHAQLSPEREHQHDLAQAMKMIEQGYCAPFPKHYVRRDGSEVPVMVSGVVVREGERVVQIWGLVQDTSERDAALAALRESEARWQFALEGAGDGVWDWDAVRDTMFFSPRWKTMLGFAAEELGDQPEVWRERVHPDDLPQCLDAVERHIKGHSELYVNEHRMRCKDGSYIWTLDRGQVVARDETGRVLRMIGTQTDISARKRAEEELRRHRDSLADLVREQTGDLVRAKEAAERALEAKSLFLANMSHELRTPMHAVLSFAQLGEGRVNTAPTAKLRDYFARIHGAGQRLMHLLNDLLDLSKFEAGRMSIASEATDILKIVREVVLEYEAWIAAKRLTLELNIPLELPLAIADAARIGQVLRNLLSNAVKFTAEDTPIAISLNAITLPRGRRAGDVGCVPGIEIVIADNGPGVPEEELEAVFDKFVQSSATRTGAGGTGLGLAICREIVHAHRGRIFARNRTGGGAEFVLQLPAVPEADKDNLSLEVMN